MNKDRNINVRRQLFFLLCMICIYVLANADKVTADIIEDMVDIKEINTRIIVEMRYATENNMAHMPLYSMNKCFLRKSTALKLDAAQKSLEKQNMSLKVWDCYRPLFVQKKLWVILPDTRYVANPVKGSRHNRACSVDVTIVNHLGKELPMPTSYDAFTYKAHRNGGDFRQQTQKNSRLLEKCMKYAGFVPLSTEWWHFDDSNWQQFKVLNIPFEQLL